MLKNRLQNQKGLTLIELLAVVVILGIIAAIAVPSIMNVIDNSKEDAVKADAIQVLNAAKLFVASEKVTDNQITKGELEQYLEGVEMLPGLVVNVTDNTNKNGKNLTITGSIEKDGKTLVLDNADLEAIDSAEFNGDEGSATGSTED